ncbi:hypothetical protein EZV62_022568 [Acer yangbiense]|uniref:Transposase MuDR plant domain-containing protein n=1 Tax=Acer yangbiense TaxID=1000413 RepID=A0A5C7H9F8_9ROSI|nr:hypothetical protein EZV62_022568 [Acer yangbiense]
MTSFNINAKFFAIQNLDQYTLCLLWGDVYMCTCATFPEPTETFKAEVKLPRTKRVRQSIVEVVDLSTDDDGNNGEQLPSYASLPSEDDEDYVPNSNYSMSKMSSDILHESTDVQSDSDTNSDDEQLSNAVSFTWNNDFMEHESSDDEVQRPGHSPRGKPYKKFAGGRVHFEVGQLFNNLNHFKLVLRDYVVQEGFKLKRIKNAKECYTAECAYEGCSWRVHASLVDDRTNFIIKTMNGIHCCQKIHKNQEANANWVAHRANNRVLNKPKKEHITSYNSLYSYGYSVRQRNPDSMVLLKTVTPHLGALARFQRFFLSFQAHKDGLLYRCRPFLGLDGCHLKGNYPGVLFSTIGIDDNNGVFSVAVCICEGESKDSWGWFIHLYMLIGLEETRRITFISDRQKGMLDAIESQFQQQKCIHEGNGKTIGEFEKKDDEKDVQASGKCKEMVLKFVPIGSKEACKKARRGQWPEVQHPEVLPPKKKRFPVRQKNNNNKINRKRGPEEPPKQKNSGPGKFTQCEEYGHNIRTCKGCEGAASKKRMGKNNTTGGKRKMNFEVSIFTSKRIEISFSSEIDY